MQNQPKISHLELESCPICEGSAKLLSCRIRTFIAQWETVVESEFAVCLDCDFGFMTNPFDNLTMGNYYKANDQLRRDFVTLEEDHHLSGQIDFIRHFTPAMKDKKVLEIGADYGAFLSKVAANISSHAYFDELNLNAQECLRKKGFKSIDDLASKDRIFDLVSLRHVFEHIPNPTSYLIFLRERISERGYVFLEVPDYTTIRDEQSDVFQLEHVNYFSLTSMVKVVAASGYDLVTFQFAQTPDYSTSPNRVLRVILQKSAVNQIQKIQSFADWEQLLKKTKSDFVELDSVRKQYPEARFAIYGAGTKTREYLANTCLDMSKVVIFDKDPKKIDTLMQNIRILDPEKISNDFFDFLIVLVVGYKKEVTQFLLEKGIDQKKLVFLKSCDSTRL